MTRWIAVLFAAMSVVGTSRAYAQESGQGPGVVELTIVPGGGTFFTESKDTGGPSSNLKTPDLLNYSGNIVLSAANKSSVVPYVTGGVGGLSLFDKAGLGIQDTETFFTSNVGGGVKWYSGRWGLRADYRFVAVQSKDDAPAFFGQETRYGHRVYGGVILNVVR